MNYIFWLWGQLLTLLSKRRSCVIMIGTFVVPIEKGQNKIELMSGLLALPLGLILKSSLLSNFTPFKTYRENVIIINWKKSKPGKITIILINKYINHDNFSVWIM